MLCFVVCSGEEQCGVISHVASVAHRALLLEGAADMDAFMASSAIQTSWSVGQEAALAGLEP